MSRQPFDVSQIGQDRPFQDPRVALEAAEGRYRDRVYEASPEARLPNTQAKVNKPLPMQIRSELGGNGSRDVPWPF